MVFAASLYNNNNKNPTSVLDISHAEQIKLLFESKLE